jgi:hypothetical protein
MSGRRRITVVLALLGVLVGLSPGVAPPALATSYGYDVSWPQCPGGQPMPPTSTSFLIIGLTNGLAFTENPCLQTQVDWARTNNKPVHAYAMSTWPTSAQYSAHGDDGPWLPTTRAARLANTGYAEATEAIADMRRVAFPTKQVWIDVEPRPAQPWPTATAAQRRENRLIIEGMMRAFRDNGFSHGIYSYANAWNDITGGWRLPGEPEWYPVGQLTGSETPLTGCSLSFAGGRTYLSQWVEDLGGGKAYDHDATCGTYSFATIAMPPSALSTSTAEFDGDWRNDVVTRTPDGNIWFYRGDERGHVLSGIRKATGWGMYDRLETVGDVTGDGAQDVLVRKPSTNQVFVYPGNGRGGWLPRILVATGWNGYDLILGPGDYNGDGRADLITRLPSTNQVFLYAGNGRGGFAARVQIATGWNGYDRIVGVGDFDGNGTNDLIARLPSTNQLFLYPGNGVGQQNPRVLVATGWSIFDAIVGVGDFNGDRTADVLTRKPSTNQVFLYPGNGSGGFLPRTLIGTGWNGRAIF